MSGDVHVRFKERLTGKLRRPTHPIDISIICQLFRLGPSFVAKITKSILDDLQKLEPERQVTFSSPESVIAKGDAKLLYVVLQNLLNNAWKFTRKKPTTSIELGVTEQNNKPVYFIRDNGAGFDMDYADKLFSLFNRLHAENEFEGYGIGLATVQRIIHRHGGRIWAEGKVNEGATFYFML
jgi:light-regulated signal transduction histidine kinase (bacteriophytochrome)